MRRKFRFTGLSFDLVRNYAAPLDFFARRQEKKKEEKAAAEAAKADEEPKQEEAQETPAEKEQGQSSVK